VEREQAGIAVKLFAQTGANNPAITPRFAGLMVDSRAMAALTSRQQVALFGNIASGEQRKFGAVERGVA
jgi:hypothetical protein